MLTAENQLNLRLRHPNFQQFLDINERESIRVKKQYRCFLDQPYGNEPLQTMDIYPAAGRNAPVLVFIHGGYWRALDKANYGFVAEPFLKNNFTVCVINYRLIPSVDMRTLLSDVQMALTWISNEVAQYNGDPNRIALSGHSAGGHLALMAYLSMEDLRPKIPAICSLSGIFDLAPIQNSYLNETLQLNERDVEDFSIKPKELLAFKCPTLLGVGTDETDFFVNQSRNLFQMKPSGSSIAYHEYEQLNHYQIVHRLGQEDSHPVNFIFEAVNFKNTTVRVQNSSD